MAHKIAAILRGTRTLAKSIRDFLIGKSVTGYEQFGVVRDFGADFLRR
jgi:hypothetical protein